MTTNSELKQRVVAIIDGEKATADEKLNLLLGITLDIHNTVYALHEQRIRSLEAYPLFAGRAIKAVMALSGLAIAVHAAYQIFLK